MTTSCTFLQDGFCPKNSVRLEVVRDQISALWHLIIESQDTSLEGTTRSQAGASATLQDTVGHYSCSLASASVVNL